MSRQRVAILISGGGSNMVALARDMEDAGHPATPCLVLSNLAGAGGLERAREMGIEAAGIDHRGFETRHEFEAAMQDRLEEARADLICLAGFMRVLTPEFLSRWQGRILNIHPSILPLFPGLNTHERALEAGMEVHGCTVHEVTPELDAGPVLGQAVIEVRPDDTAASLAARLLPFEHRLYPAVLRRFAAGDRKKLAILG